MEVVLPSGQRVQSGLGGKPKYAACNLLRQVLIQYKKTLYYQCHEIENMFGRLKDWRLVDIRYADALILSYQPSTRLAPVIW